MMNNQHHTLGNNYHRKDGIAKATGPETYASNVTLLRMWHARIVSIDRRGAEAMGAVVLAYDNVPHLKYNERTVSIPPHLYRDRTVLADKARYVGEAVDAPVERFLG